MVRSGNAVPDYLQRLFARVLDKWVRVLRNSKLDLNLPAFENILRTKIFSFREPNFGSN